MMALVVIDMSHRHLLTVSSSVCVRFGVVEVLEIAIERV